MGKLIDAYKLETYLKAAIVRVRDGDSELTKFSSGFIDGLNLAIEYVRGLEQGASDEQISQLN